MTSTSPGLRSIGLVAFATLLIPVLGFVFVALLALAEGQVEAGLVLGGITFLGYTLFLLAPVLISAALALVFWSRLQHHRFLTLLAGGAVGTAALSTAVNFWMALLFGFLPAGISAVIALDYRDAASKRSEKMDG